MTTRAVLVAGGRGARLGLGTAKALAVVHGTTLLERAVATLAEVADEVIVAAPAAVELPLPAAAIPVRRVVDRAPGGGPLAGIVAGLETGAWDRAIVLGVDFPRVRAEALVALLARLPGRSAVVPAPGGRPQPLVAAIDRDGAAALTLAFDSGERSIVRAMEGLPSWVLADAELADLPGGLDNFLNVNTPEDLRRAEARMAAGAARR